MNRTEAREYMMGIIFQMDAKDEFDINEIATYTKPIKPVKQRNYGETVYSLMCNKKEDIDEEIRKYSPKWKLERMPKSDVAILRLAILEILYIEDIPDSVSINEAVELAKKFGSDNAPSYINGILGSVSRNKEEK